MLFTINLHSHNINNNEQHKMLIFSDLFLLYVVDVNESLIYLNHVCVHYSLHSFVNCPCDLLIYLPIICKPVSCVHVHLLLEHLVK